MVLPLLGIVLSPLDQDSPTVVFPDTSVSALQALVTLIYEGSIITSQDITSEVLATMKNLGIDPDKFSKVCLAGCFVNELLFNEFLLSLFRSSSPSPSQG